MSQDTSRQYDNDGVTRIIRRALKLNNQDAISHNELMDTASQIESIFFSTPSQKSGDRPPALATRWR